MNEQTETQNISTVSPDESETIVLIKKLQQHLVYLEKKIDILIAAKSQKPFGQKPFNGKRFSKPTRYGGNSHQRPRTEGGNSMGERNFRGGPRPFDRPQTVRTAPCTNIAAASLYVALAR